MGILFSQINPIKQHCKRHEIITISMVEITFLQIFLLLKKQLIQLN